MFEEGNFKGAIIFYREGGHLWGDHIFWGWSKGGTNFFSVGLGGDQNFLRVKEGGLKCFLNFFLDILYAT